MLRTLYAHHLLQEKQAYKAWGVLDKLKAMMKRPKDQAELITELELVDVAFERHKQEVIDGHDL